MPSTDELHEVAMHAMERRILFGFALNSGRPSLTFMSPAESMSACGIINERGENITWARATERLVERGVLEARRIEAGGCSIPVFAVAERTAVPFHDAMSMRLRMRPSQLRARILKPTGGFNG